MVNAPHPSAKPPQTRRIIGVVAVDDDERAAT
jgi:hypothetical protein